MSKNFEENDIHRISRYTPRLAVFAKKAIYDGTFFDNHARIQGRQYVCKTKNPRLSPQNKLLQHRGVESQALQNERYRGERIVWAEKGRVGSWDRTTGLF